MAKVLVLYYSMYGHVERMAKAVSAGVSEAGGIAELRRVPETIADEKLRKLGAIRDASIADASVEELPDYDAVVFGSPTRYGVVCSQMRAFIDQIPKDIIICAWHYEVRESYPSIPMFINKGFRVLPAGWKNVDATKALIKYSQSQANPKLLGYMFTTWGVKKDALVAFQPLVEGLELLRE